MGGIRVMIIGCTSDDVWYANKIGKIFTVADKDRNEYLVRTGDKKIPFDTVLISDCQVL